MDKPGQKTQTNSVVGLQRLRAALRMPWFDQLHSVTDVRRHLKETVLAQIPMASPASGPSSRGPFQLTDASFSVTEAFRNLRSALLFMSKVSSGRLLAVTSAKAGEGKSSVTVNLAQTMARAGLRVLIIDGDPRRAGLHWVFKVPLAPGWTEVLAGRIHWSQTVSPTATPGLAVVAAGHPASGRPLEHPAQIITEMREQFDYLLVDSPSVLSRHGPDNLIARADGVVVVLRAAYARIRFVRQALARLREEKAKVLGLVFNGVAAEHRQQYHFGQRAA
jgi:capsular exopolysaccharide synthesis family protein